MRARLDASDAVPGELRRNFLEVLDRALAGTAGFAGLPRDKRAEAIRQALRLWLQQQQPAHGEVFGLWRDRPEGSLALQDAMRQEWSAR